MNAAAQRVLSVTRTIDAPTERLYAILTDYHEGHPSILPRPPFVSLTVEEGGVGAGTRIRVEMKVLGRRQSFRADVSEPEPGRVLVETNDTGYVTTFTVEERSDGRGTDVTFSTTLAGTGISKSIERWISARLLRPVYERELDLLAARVAGRPVAGP